MPVAVEVKGFDVWDFGDWQVSVTHQLVEKIIAARLNKLRKETGGILIGGFDFEHKKIYLTDTILSPTDSKEYPTAYIRGIEGLEAALSSYSEKTADHLKYAGEWHSHPENCALSQSDDDKILFQHIHAEMRALGFPTIMLIAGDCGKYEIYFKE
ncbi:Mov34/MPN/PAD-1 family protein [Mucilaginibacter daejeonensis]|uniref:Mov34/MPN/PAD-1 family protein n=1 Tax=Mucilaginibacter daejeonensis TaxID=398049 RepID=UPI001D17C8D0|nr:Mov34/MPN/PAD-1 family protein [Mucilaginibacter daejeonensis]UEG51852.1 Mov34/MPN/PAD-1 family protein [Mucilaginibacter daejeonensis]